MDKKKKKTIGIIAVCLIVILVVGGVLGYTLYQMHQAESLVFSSFSDSTQEEYNGSWMIDVNKNDTNGVKTSVIEISNNSSNTVIKHLKLEDKEAWKPYLATLTVTIDGTNLISKDILDEEALDFELSSDASCYMIIEYSFKQNIADTSQMPDTIQISPVI